MNKLLNILIFFLIFLGLGISCASAANVSLSFDPQTIEVHPGSSQIVKIVMDKVPEAGFAGFNITASVADPTIATITDVSPPDWAGGYGSTGTDSSGSVWISAFNGDVKKPGDISVSFGTITITGVKEDTTNLSIVRTKINDALYGDRIYPDLPLGTINVSKFAPTITWANPTDITYGIALGAAQLNAAASYNGNPIDGTFAFTYDDGIPIQSGVTILPAGTHTLTATFTPTDANYATATASVQIKVNPATYTITWDKPADIAYGTLLSGTQLNAKADIAGTFTYDPAAGTKLPVGTQTLNVTFTPSDANYTTQTASVQINVTAVIYTITWDNPADITYGTPLGADQLNAKADIAGTFIYDPAAGTVLGVGTHTLNATFTPEDSNYAPQTASVQIKVNPTTYNITWDMPADITYGTALSDTQLNAAASIPGTFTYDPAAGTKLSVGTHTLNVTFTPSDANYSAQTASVEINVKQTTYIITWNNPADITYGTLLSDTQLNAKADIDGTFTYDPAAGTVLDVGTHTLNATFTPTDANYTLQTASVQIKVNPTTYNITWDRPADITYGTALGDAQLNAKAEIDGTFAYDPVAGAVLPAGTQTLKATFTPADTNYAPQTASVQINVTKATPVITWDKPADITYGTLLGDAQLNAQANVAGTFTYDPAAGTVLDVGKHTLNVTFTPSDANYSAQTVSVEINVKPTTYTITWNNPADITYGTPLGADQLDAKADIDGTFIYDPATGTVLPAGTQTLKATFTPADTNYVPQTASVQINVTKATPVITWDKPADIAYGILLGDAQLNAKANVDGQFSYDPVAGTKLPVGTQTLNVTFTPSDANYTTQTASVQINVTAVTYTITWDKPADIIYGTPLSATQLNAKADIAGTFTYDPVAGTVLPIGTHTLNATFTPEDSNYAPQTASVQIKINPATYNITWNNPADITYGTPLGADQLNAKADINGTFSYDPASGTVLDVGKHTLNVTFTPSDANYSAQTVSVEINAKPATYTITWNNPADITYGTPLGADQLDAVASIPGTFVYDPVAGTVLPAGTQKLNATFTPTNANYAPQTVSVQIKVNPATYTITWNNPQDVVYGTSLSNTQLNAKADIAGTFTYDPVAGTVLPAGTQTLKATLTPADANYAPQTTSVQIKVTKATPVITWNKPADITYGALLGDAQLNAQANVAGTFTYDPVAGTKLPVGTQTLKATFTPSDANYTTQTASVQINVTGATYTITWNNPADITYGTPLGATQLNAATSIPGTFVYDPVAGTVLPAGTQTLKATFTPSDANYAPQTSSVQIKVNPATPVITWNNPADITYGTSLSDTQLNAQANVPGTFAYTLSDGTPIESGVTVLPVGTHTLKVTCTPNDPNCVAATASVQINVISAPTSALSITKAANVTSYIAAGQVIKYTYNVTNTGNTAISAPITVTDNKTGTVVIQNTGVLAVGAMISSTANYIVTSSDVNNGSITNSAFATAGSIVSNTVNVTVTKAAVQGPALTITKTANPTTYSAAGQKIAYTYTVTNSGTVPLRNIAVTDNKVSVTISSATLAPGSSVTGTGTYTIKQSDITTGSVTNTAYATGRYNGNKVTSNTVTTTVTSTVIVNPALTITKTANPTTYSAKGQTIKYTYTVTNSGTVPIRSISVKDNKTSVSISSGTLSPGSSFTGTGTYTIKQSDINAGSVTNSATATGIYSGKTVTSNTATTTVTSTVIVNPALTITKTANPTTYNAVGQKIAYTYVVTNSGTVPIKSIKVTDNKISVTISSGTLAPGSSVTGKGTYTIKQADINAGSVTNSATATGTYNGNTVTSNTATTAITSTFVPTPALTITKTPHQKTYNKVGRVITYTYIVKNTGNVPISGIKVTDNKSKVSLESSRTLAPGSSVAGESNYVIKQADVTEGSVTNSAYATGTYNGQAVTSNTVTATVTYKKS